MQDVIEAYGYNGRQALRLVYEKCVSACRWIDFFLQFTEFCVRYSIRGAIFISYTWICILPTKTGGSEKWWR